MSIEPPSPPHQATIERVVTTLRELADRPLTLHDMADLAGLSPFHFSRVFRSTTGVPPGEFNAALRLARAKELLLTTPLSVTEICFEVGYESLGAFTSRFTRLVGVSPGQFRQLPEVSAPLFEQVATERPALVRREAGAVAVAGEILSPDADVSLIFAGLFPTGMPSGCPVAGTILTAPGHFAIGDVPDGTYRLLVAALTTPAPLAACLAPTEGTFVGGWGPVVVRQGRARDRIQLRLRPPHALDPPVLIALPALLLSEFSDEPRLIGRRRKIEEATVA